MGPLGRAIVILVTYWETPPHRSTTTKMVHSNTLGLGLSQCPPDHQIKVSALKPVPKPEPLSIEAPAPPVKPEVKKAAGKKVITIRIKSKMLKTWLEKRIEAEKKKKADRV